MPPRTRPGRTRGAPRSRRPRQTEDEIPEVYKEMLAEVEAREGDSAENERPAKRFKPAGNRAAPAQPNDADRQTSSTGAEDSAEDNSNAARHPQTVYKSPSESDESDMEWEEVDIQQAQAQPTAPGSSAQVGDEPLQITLGQREERKRRVVRRKPVTAAVKELRLDVHKTHILCLMCHVQRRNLWCNDEEVQGNVKRILSKHIRSQLNPPDEKPQHTRSAMFMDGLNQAGDVFFRKFTITKPGLRRPHWVTDSDALKRATEGIMSDAEVFLSCEDFRNQAKSMQGSRDFGAQLFCALLRSVAVDARLVCSLQPLPFSGTAQLPPKPEPEAIVISSDDPESLTDGNKSEGNPPPIRRIGRPGFKPTRVHHTSTARPKRTESSYPVFWVEAFNEAFQKWIVVDPMVTKTLAKPHKLEPPSTDPYNLLSYVVAFEEDASARDVTRRYTRVFNAKTRKSRVESTKNGEVWWKRALKHFEKPFLEDRDEVEIGELTAKTASEPMPRNVQDFKDHPIYALERQLRRNEVIHPKRVTGHVSLGKAGAKGQTEPVYRRSDVHTLRSANKWYRLGRDIKVGEQALKRIPARSKGMGLDEDEDAEEITLYALYQTAVYKPPPVVQGRIPKNAYGNLDIYVPSMVPPGGVHIRNLDAAYAARLLGIDYADAVTGFSFKGRHGTAVLQGVVVAVEYWEAVEEVLRCLEEEKVRNLLEERSTQVLRVWKHLLLKLRISERVKGYALEGEADDESSVAANSEPEEGCGFFPESVAEMASPPRVAEHGAQDDMGGGFLPEGGVPSPPQSGTLDRQNDTSRDQVESLAGGFVPDEEVRASVRRHGVPVARPRYDLVVVPNTTSGLPERDSTASDPIPDRASTELQGTSAKAPITVPSPPNEPTPSNPNATSQSDILGASANEPITVPSPAPQSMSATDAPIVVDSSNNNSASASVEILSRAPSQVPSRAQSVDAGSTHSEANEGSLLSEDPEDEDAVPEWLMSD